MDETLWSRCQDAALRLLPSARKSSEIAQPLAWIILVACMQTARFGKEISLVSRRKPSERRPPLGCVFSIFKTIVIEKMLEVVPQAAAIVP